MAFAYYHYPLYDEALGKVLRIIEMFVKLKCERLHISTKKETKDGGKVDITLFDLMNFLKRKEPLKNLADQLQAMRSLRNLMMHPDRHSYSGPIGAGVIRSAVTIINKLFLSEILFAEVDTEVRQRKLSLPAFKKNVVLLNTESGRYLIERVDVVSALLIQKRWIYLLIGYPIMLDARKHISEHSYINPLVFSVHNIQSTEEGLNALTVESSLAISIFKSEAPQDIKTYENYLLEINQSDAELRDSYFHHLEREINKVILDFHYQFLHQVDSPLYLK